jgi:hypothetical protein
METLIGKTAGNRKLGRRRRYEDNIKMVAYRYFRADGTVY